MRLNLENEDNNMKIRYATKEDADILSKNDKHISKQELIIGLNIG